MLDEAAGDLRSAPGRVVGAVVPHAGYPYSGPTAARVYHVLRGMEFETAVFVGPSHRESFRGSSIFAGRAFSTPLGEVEIDAELSTALVAHGGSIFASSVGHRQEHAIEVQLPFLQVVRPQARMVAITMGEQSARSCQELVAALATGLLRRSVVLIASSDLSHYHPYAEAVRLDRIVASHIRTFQPERLQDDLQQDRVEACGGGPVVTVMSAARSLGATTATILHICNSGDVTGDHSGVVGYLSAIFSAN